MGKPRVSRTPIDLIKGHDLDIKKLFGLFRKQASGVASVGGVPNNFGGGGSSTKGDYVKKSGDTMQGPLGFTPQKLELNSSSNTLNLEHDTIGGASYIYVTPIGSHTTMDTITGNVMDNQILIMQGTQTLSITLRDRSVSSGGNIHVPGNTSFVLKNDNLIFLLWDSVEGEWRFLATGDTVMLGEDGNANGFTIKNLATPVDCGDAVNKCYIDKKIQDLISANNLIDSGTIIEILKVIVKCQGDGLDEWKDIGFIEPRSGSTLQPPNITFLITTRVDQTGHLQWSDVGPIQPSGGGKDLEEGITFCRDYDMFSNTDPADITHSGSVTVASTSHDGVIDTYQWAGQTLTIKINGVTQSTVVLAGDGSFSKTFTVTGVIFPGSGIIGLYPGSGNPALNVISIV